MSQFGTQGEAPALALRALSKSFGAQHALTSVDLTVRRGEVHALLGENGSGKSTLIKILAGFYVPDSGSLFVNGGSVPLPIPPGGFRRWAMEFVHQDLGLIATLSVAENLLIGHLAGMRGGWCLSHGKLVEEAARILARHQVVLDPEAAVQSLSPVERALVAIVRALSGIEDSATGHGLLVLDEPTVFLPRREIDRLFELVRRVADQGGAVLFVSHDLDEVMELTHSVTVLRDGRVAGERNTDDLSKSDLVELIVGHQLLPPAAIQKRASTAPVRLSAAGVTTRLLNNVDLDIHEGEILGVTGLAGSGFEEFPYALFGAGGRATGTVTVSGRVTELAVMDPVRALGLGIALLPADRRKDGSIGTLSATDNVTMGHLQAFSKVGRLMRRRMTATTRELMDRFDVRPRDPEATFGNLSGGNQQKALLAKWLVPPPDVLLVHEPTQGVDVGAREQIYEVLRDSARAGTAVLCASSDYEQLAVLCDRVVVFGRGQIGAELQGDELTKERIIDACYRSLASLEATEEAV